MAVSRRGIVLISLLIVFSLAIGIFWTIRLSPPSPTPWWWGKNPNIHAEVWEPGQDMATVAMRMPKSFFDTVVALGLPAKIKVHSAHEIRLNAIWKQLERLPRGQKLKLEQEGATVYLWIDVGG